MKGQTGAVSHTLLYARGYLFRNKELGPIICMHLQDPGAGLLGVAGGDAKSRVPSSWSLPIASNHINLVQHYKHAAIPPDRILTTDNRTNAAG